MNKQERIERINKVLKDYFTNNPGASVVPAKDFMPLFIEAGIFNKDEKNGLPNENRINETRSTKTSKGWFLGSVHPIHV
ncbi:MAG: hypothetical protein K5896_05880 [Prevotella sp.]|nr:hypothetical protein [Prevotella sp.]